jgi:hypothetical protein
MRPGWPHSAHIPAASEPPAEPPAYIPPAPPPLVYATADARRQAEAALPPGACVEVEVARRVERSQLSRHGRSGAVLANRDERWTHSKGWSARLVRSSGRLDPSRRAWLVVEIVAR